eukprot:INCI1539.4.p1 GENE.INCI1539.4~~INCI1539.4.p1  ORF type:complete len:140 (+),score=10.82 INCI1539.4:335-754(+)
MPSVVVRCLRQGSTLYCVELCACMSHYHCVKAFPYALCFAEFMSSAQMGLPTTIPSAIVFTLGLIVKARRSTPTRIHKTNTPENQRPPNTTPAATAAPPKTATTGQPRQRRLRRNGTHMCKSAERLPKELGMVPVNSFL